MAVNDSPVVKFSNDATYNADSCGGDAFRGTSILVAIVLITASVWGWLLPMLGNVESMRVRIESTERRGINPAAIYYTDVFDSRSLSRPNQRISQP